MFGLRAATFQSQQPPTSVLAAISFFPADKSQSAPRGSADPSDDTSGPGNPSPPAPTPVSTYTPLAKIFGQFQALKRASANGPFLCEYVDIVKKHRGQIYVVSSFHKNSVHRRLTESPQVDIKKVITWIRQILEALCFLAERGIVHRNLCLKNVLLDEHDSVRLFNYGLYCMTDCGRDASFPIGYPPYLPPEVLIGDQESLYRSSAKADVWSLGILALEMLSMNVVTAPEQLGLTSGQLKDWVDYISQWKLDSEIATEALPRQASVTVSEHPELLHFIQSCLVVSVEDRPDFRQLLGHPVFIGLPQVPPTPSLTGWHLHPHLPLLQEDSDASGNSNAVLSDTERLLSSFSLYQIFHLWILAGGILDIPVVKRNGISTSAINRLPQVIRIKDDVEDILSLTDVAPLFSDSICIFPLEPLAEKLATTTQPSLPKGLAAMDDLGLYYKSIEGRNVQRWAQSLLEAPDYWTKRSSQLTEKQRDPSHQARLIVMFNRHLAEYPHSQRRIIEEATIGIPALVRNRVWAAILGISGNPQIEYDMIDKDSEGLMDRQLELDIPRCHQYNEVLASPFGHQKLKRILKAWVASEEHRMVYWQGLDSVCAPFLCLNLHDEALAYSCLKEFVSRFLSDFFVVDNTITINKYMTVFSKLIAFHDPELALHMLTLGLQPSLYAIPWFMTMYAHIFPLDKIYPLWDNLLVGGDYVGLHFGLAILTQLRDQIIHHDFNQCMVLLSELPNIEIEAAISDANFTFKTTPPSFYDNLRSQPRKSEIGKHKGDSHAELPWISVKDFSQIKSISLILDTRDSFAEGHIHYSFHLDLYHEPQSNFMTNIRILSQRTKYIALLVDGVTPQLISFCELIISSGLSKLLILDMSTNCEEQAPEECHCQPTVVKNGLSKCHNGHRRTAE